MVWCSLPGPRHRSPSLAQAFVSVVEDRGTTLDAGKIMLMRGADPINREGNTSGLATT
jgi:hypothetical protein